MKKTSFFKPSLAMFLLLTIASCNKNSDTSNIPPPVTRANLEEMISEKGSNPDEVAVNTNTGTEALSNRPGGDFGEHHFLYTETNGAGKNEIVSYEIMHQGRLRWDGATVSGGMGTGKALGSQGALALDKNHEWLFAVNAGSNSVTVYKLHNDGSLTLSHTKNSGGLEPVSLTVHNNLLYVLNRGSDAIHGFYIHSGGGLSDIPGSTQPLSGTAVAPPQISFTPDGGWLVVTEKATNIVSTFRVKNDGAAAPGIFTPSVGQTPFGFDFSRGRFMVVTNAAGGTAGAGSVTSYLVGNNGIPKDVNGAVPNFQAAPCWMAVTRYGRFAFASNTGSNDISSYYVAPWGAIYLIREKAVATDLAPADIVVSANNCYVYVLTAKSNTIGGFRRQLLGGLISLGSVSGLPASTTGLAIY